MKHTVDQQWLRHHVQSVMAKREARGVLCVQEQGELAPSQPFVRHESNRPQPTRHRAPDDFSDAFGDVRRLAADPPGAAAAIDSAQR